MSHHQTEQYHHSLLTTLYIVCLSYLNLHNRDIQHFEGMIEVGYWKMRCLIGGVRVLLEHVGEGIGYRAELRK